MTKRCPRCGETKPLESGYYRKNGGFHSRCKECEKAVRRKPRTCLGCGTTYYHAGSSGSRRLLCDDCATRGKVCARCREFKPFDHFYGSPTKNGNRYCRDGCALAVNREIRYGITSGGHDAALAPHGKSCGACGRTDRTLCVDHDHATGAIRGLLCGPCNSGIGMLGDSVDTLLGAVAYLKRHQSGSSV